MTVRFIFRPQVRAYSGSAPQLAASVLAVAGRYVHWMDIGLVANERCAAR